MNLVEQAIFTSSEAGGDAGYQVLARSPGVCEADARELAAWEPSRDSMIEMGSDANSLNFHPLPSGVYCISRTTLAGWEHGRGQRVFTHCLIVPSEVLTRFANNPFAVGQAVSQRGLWLKPEDPCSRLEPFVLAGGVAAVDEALLRQLAADPGPESMAALVQAVRDAVCLAIVGANPSSALIAGLFSCLPVECRLDFSFSTGLKFSPRRPFRIVALSDDQAEQLWVAGYANVTVLKIGNGLASKMVSLDGWTRLIERTLATGNIPFLAAQISKRRFDLSPDDLPALGLQLLEGLDGSEFFGGDSMKASGENRSPAAGQRAHAAHRQFAKSVAAASTTISAAVPSAQLGLHSPEVLEKLEHLDDLVYEAISGQGIALEQLRSAWPALLNELGEEALAESREQYLRYAVSIWEESAAADAIRDPARAVQALDVLCLLFGDMA